MSKQSRARKKHKRTEAEAPRRRGREAFNRLDSAGIVGYRAWLYSEDDKGTRIPAQPANFEGMHVHPSHHYAPVPVGDFTETEMQRMAMARVDEYTESLTPIEREVLYLQGKLCKWVTRNEWIIAGDLPGRLKEGGCTYLPGEGKMTQPRAGLPDLELVCIETREFEQARDLDYAEIAARMGLSIWQVQRAVKSANRKTRERRK